MTGTQNAPKMACESGSDETRGTQELTPLKLYIDLPLRADPWAALSIDVKVDKPDRPLLDHVGKQSDLAIGLVKTPLRAQL
ncbi:uncharacterized protein PV07_06278 [Cladophialophora immunda]|uniref:Uncharacterized protein n=1 Tax=Cladophialophora immunda TaxID=569365 RepID=A0A0D2D4F3_9EURO|nr:uncharacterized protein PV07_06278 [Cladophialophora immunda]KIW30539.1 hypothetical protein PV07_06278 [Cladophialophora immunda]